MKKKNKYTLINNETGEIRYYSKLEWNLALGLLWVLGIIYGLLISTYF